MFPVTGPCVRLLFQSLVTGKTDLKALMPASVGHPTPDGVQACSFSHHGMARSHRLVVSTAATRLPLLRGWRPRDAPTWRRADSAAYASSTDLTAATTSSWMEAAVATMPLLAVMRVPVVKSSGRPCTSDTRPPASVTMRKPAA